MEKIKNLPVMRFVAFAVALAIILGLSSVMLSFTASAETANDTVSQLGTLGNYDCIKFKAGQKIDFNTLYDQRNRYNSQYVIGAVFGYKNGKFVNFKNNNFSIRPQSDSEYFNVYFCGTTMFGNWVFGDKAVLDSVYYQYGLYNSTYCSMCLGVKDTEISVKGSVKLADSSQSFYDSVGDTLYLVYTSSNSLWTSTQINDFCNEIVNNLTDDNYKDFTPPPSGGNENGRFICFGNYKEYPYDIHLTDISSGAVYQRIDYLASEQSKFTAFMFDDTSCFTWADERVKSGHIVMYSSTSIAFNFYNSSDSVGAVKLRVSKTQMFPSLRESDNPFDVTHYFVMKPANKHFSRYVIIEDGSLRSVPAKSTSTFRVNMQGYCNMDWNSYYLLEIVDVQTDTVISSAMFVYTGKNSGKIDGSNIKNGSFVSVDYQYEDGNKVNNGSLTPDSDGTLPNLPNGIKDETYNPTPNYNLSNLDISDIFSSLNQATASIGAFFQATLNIIPISIMTLILGSMALLIVLRVLGR